MKKIIKRILWILLAALLIFVTWYVWPRLPIITAFAAKGMCSSVFLADKEPERVYAEDLSFFPISAAKCEIDYDEKSVTSRVLGLAKRKAVFREGLGAVLVLEKPEDELRAASFEIPDPDYSQDSIPWPLGDVVSDLLPDGVDYVRLASVLEEAIDGPDDEPVKKSLGVAVVYDNELIGEHYLAGYDSDTRFHAWSMTKSVAGALAGILVNEGRLDIHTPVDVPEWANDQRRNITLENILQMNSGLDWVENYFTISEATIMLMQKDDMLSWIVSCEAAHDPGTYWNYSGGDANLISAMVRKAMTNDQEYYSYLYKQLFHRIGMQNTVVETDGSGLFVASSFSYGTVRDWARFGLLFLNEGIFEGDTVLPPAWVEFMRTEAPHSDGNYGGTFWFKEPNPERALIDVPDDVYFADGFQGQRVYIIPSKKLVVVRMGYSLSNFSLNDFLRDIIATLPE